jgi:putative ABC transport system permease protein
LCEWAEQRSKPEVRGVRVESLESGRPEMRQTLDRAEKFLNLVALLAALLSAVAVALAARGFAASPPGRLRHAARAGPKPAHHCGSLHAEFALIGLFASALGVALGFGVHHVFVLLLAGLVESACPRQPVAGGCFGLGMG